MKPDRDIPVDLAAVYFKSFTSGRYAKSIDYSASLEIPMDGETRQWAEAIGKKVA